MGVATGARPGKRASKLRDWGKRAAAFVDLSTGRAIRIAARESSKELARQLHPEIENKNQQQMAAYRELPDADLFTEQWVSVQIHPREFPGYKGERVACSICGESISYDRFLRDGEAVLCIPCAHPELRYYQSLQSEPASGATDEKSEIPDASSS